MTIRRNAPHYLYRCYDEAGRLIYVGSTVNLLARLRAHESRSFWAPQIARVETDGFPNGMDARAEERRAIREDNPRWNIQGRWSPLRRSGRMADVLDYRRAFVEAGNEHTAWGRKHLATIDAFISTIVPTEEPAA